MATVVILKTIELKGNNPLLLPSKYVITHFVKATIFQYEGQV